MKLPDRELLRKYGAALLRDAVPLWASHACKEPSPMLRHGGAAVTTESGAELLKASRDGEQVVLELDVLAFQQMPDTPNRNFLRFRDGALIPMGRTGRDTVFLRDHKQYDILARGGTVTASKMHKKGAGHYELHQTLLLHEPWAVQGALTGSIDRFSIGWRAIGPILCSVCNAPVYETCWHWPGDVVEREGLETVVEWVYTKAELLETSTVCVPAVTGTTVKEIRAALAAVPLSRFTSLSAGPRPTEYAMNDEQLATLRKTLGLGADADVASILTAASAGQATLAEQSEMLEALGAERDRYKAEALQAAASLADQAAATAAKEGESLIASLLEAGHIKANGPRESLLRDTLAAQGLEATQRLGEAFASEETPLSQLMSGQQTPPPIAPRAGALSAGGALGAPSAATQPADAFAALPQHLREAKPDGVSAETFLAANPDLVARHLA